MIGALFGGILGLIIGFVVSLTIWMTGTHGLLALIATPIFIFVGLIFGYTIEAELMDNG